MTQLTNEQKFSPSYGFEPGVVVEIRFDGEPYIGWFADLCGPHIRIHERYQEAKTSFRGDLVESIRILSGPFGVWQFAPKTATFAIIYEENEYIKKESLVAFVQDGEKPSDFDEHGRLRTMPRPWWLEGKELPNETA